MSAGHFFLLMSSISLCSCTTICLSSLLLMEIWVGSSFQLLWVKNMTVNIFVPVFSVDILLLYFGGKILGVEWLDHWVGIYLIVWEIAKHLFQSGCTFSLTSARYECSKCFMSLSTFWVFTLLTCSCGNGCVVVPQCDFNF